ncbi:MAG: carboxylating nicotinate-nucleotide diphosphorylase [Leptospiraceae bacterium]|nr:carboxylating nicotinate-nucleotide diphosphorylase [Leptospiraceae bacterium]
MVFDENRGYTTPISILGLEDFDAILNLALAEDAPKGDVTSESIFPVSHSTKAILKARESGVLCGSGVIAALSRKFPNQIRFHIHLEDGAELKPGSIIADLEGNTQILFRIERILLNLLQYLSGIASATSLLVHKYPNLKILDTRKTLPAYRKLAKYAVYTGGAWNHRIHLSDMAMIKDNHIEAIGSITKAVEAIRQAQPDLKIEIEIDRMDQLQEAISNSPDVILLDNFTLEDTAKAVEVIRSSPATKSILVEASGNITPDKLNGLSEIGGIGVSMGYLTHTTRFLDIGLDMVY